MAPRLYEASFLPDVTQGQQVGGWKPRASPGTGKARNNGWLWAQGIAALGLLHPHGDLGTIAPPAAPTPPGLDSRPADRTAARDATQTVPPPVSGTLGALELRCTQDGQRRLSYCSRLYLAFMYFWPGR